MTLAHIDPTSGYRVTSRVRLDEPALKPDGTPDKKHLQPFGDNRHLYFTPAQQDGRRQLVIGLGGCWNFRGRIGKEVDAAGARVDVKGHSLTFTTSSGRTGSRSCCSIRGRMTPLPVSEQVRRAVQDWLETKRVKVKTSARGQAPASASNRYLTVMDATDLLYRRMIDSDPDGLEGRKRNGGASWIFSAEAAQRRAVRNRSVSPRHSSQRTLPK